MRSQEPLARRLPSCRCRILSLLTAPFGNGDARIRPRALRLAHPFVTRSLRGEDHLAATIDVALSRGPASSRTRGGPFAGDRRCVHHHRRVFVTRSPIERRALAGSLSGLSCKAPCEVSPGSDVPLIEDAYGRLLLIHGFSNGHPSYRVATEPLAFPAATFCDATTVSTETGADGVSRHRARFGGSSSRETGSVLPVLRRALRSTSDAPVAVPEPRVAILRERRALGSAEIVSNPHIVKRAGLPDPRRLRRLAGVPLSRCLFRDVPWPLARTHGSDGGDATSTTIRGRTHALS